MALGEEGCVGTRDLLTLDSRDPLMLDDPVTLDSRNPHTLDDRLWVGWLNGFFIHQGGVPRE